MLTKPLALSAIAYCPETDGIGIEGNLLLAGSERAELEKQRAERAERKAERLAKRLREMGIDPEADE